MADCNIVATFGSFNASFNASVPDGSAAFRVLKVALICAVQQRRWMCVVCMAMFVAISFLNCPYHLGGVLIGGVWKSFFHRSEAVAYVHRRGRAFCDAFVWGIVGLYLLAKCFFAGCAAVRSHIVNPSHQRPSQQAVFVHL